MSSGLSMANVNKIKQLADQHEYSLAVDILDSQELERSLNPQFLRTCGEIYENVGRLTEARGLYVKAHSMAPEANRIIFSLIEFYLRRGQRELAKRYLEEFESNDSSSDGQAFRNAEFIVKKADKADASSLYDMLYPYYRDTMDERWTYEAFLLAYKLEKKDDYDILSSDYIATYKDNDYAVNIKNVIGGKTDVDSLIYEYTSQGFEDELPEEEQTRKLEADQLKADYLRRNPSIEDAVITEMVTDDSSGGFFGIKKKKNIQNEADTEVAKEADKDSAENAGAAVEKGIKSFIRKKFGIAGDGKTDEEKSDEEKPNEEKLNAEKPDEISSSEEKKVEISESEQGVIAEEAEPAAKDITSEEDKVTSEEKRADESPYKEKSDSDEITEPGYSEVRNGSGDTEEKSDSEIIEESDKDKVSAIRSSIEETLGKVEFVNDDQPEKKRKSPGSVFAKLFGRKEAEEEVTDDSVANLVPDKGMDDSAEAADYSENGESSGGKADSSQDGISDETDITSDESLSDAEDKLSSLHEARTTTRPDMKEIRPEKEFITYDFDDGFAPESDTIAGLVAEETESFENPFDSISAYKELERKKKNLQIEFKEKTEEDIENEYHIKFFRDEETKDTEDIETSIDKVDAEASLDIMSESSVEEISEEFTEEISEEFTEEIYEEPDKQEELSEYISEEVEESVEEISEEHEYSADDISDESVSEVDSISETEAIDETGAQSNEVIDFESDITDEGYDYVVDSSGEEESEVEEEPEIEEKSEIEEEPETEEEPEVEEESEADEDPEVNDEPHFRFEFPEFKTDLFPNLDKDEPVHENRFESIVEEQKSQLDERLLEEEKKLREAEELLKSLGIDIN